MNLRTKLVSLTSAVVLATLAVVSSAGAAHVTTPSTHASTGRLVHSVTAAASAGWATLYIYDFDDGNYWITVEGQANLASVPSGNMYITLYGDDWFDTTLWSTHWLSTNADGSFYIEFPLCCSVLNEDWGEDEIYAKVRAWYAPDGGNVTLTTNNVEGDF